MKTRGPGNCHLCGQWFQTWIDYYKHKLRSHTRLVTDGNAIHTGEYKNGVPVYRVKLKEVPTETGEWDQVRESAANKVASVAHLVQERMNPTETGK